MIKKVKFGLNIKFIVATWSIIIFTSILLSYFFIDIQYQMLKKFTENRAIVVATSLATSSEYAVSSYEQSREFLHHLVKNSLKEDILEGNLIYSAIYDKEGILLVSEMKTNENIEKYVKSTPIEVGLIRNLEKNSIQEDIVSISKIGKVIDIIIPIISIDFNPEIKMTKQKRDTIVGAVRIGVSLNEINRERNNMIKTAFLLTLFILFICTIFSFLFVKIITKEDLFLGTQK